MDRNFFLPIAVAAGVHSLLFISGTPTTVPPHKPVAAPTDSWNPPPPIPLDLLDPPPAEIAGGEKPSTSKPPPISDERLTTLPDPKDFVQEAKLEDLRPRPSSDINTIDSGWESIPRSGTGTNAGIFDSISLDNRPMARFQPAPIYPRELKPTGADGEVTVTFSVDVNGDVFNATVIRASHTRFGEEALRAVKRWRFEPGIKNNKRVAFRMVQTFSFTLSE